MLKLIQLNFYEQFIYTLFTYNKTMFTIKNSDTDDPVRTAITLCAFGLRNKILRIPYTLRKLK